MKLKLTLFVFSTLFIFGCAEMETKQDAFPRMYSDEKPVSIIVVPAINESTAADAGALLNVTLAQPFTNHGYYVLPVPIVADIFRREGIVSGSQLKGRSTQMFKDSFGADAVLFVTIKSWDTNYVVVAGNVTVGMEYVLMSTATDEVLWSYEELVAIGTSGSSGFILADIIATAISAAMTDYVPVARQVHQVAVKALPYGVYHPKNGLDGAEKSVKTLGKSGALDES